MKNVVIDLAATDPETVPSAASVAAVAAQFLDPSDTNACTAAGVTSPEIFKFTVAADPLELIATTAIVPSSFLNAAVRSPFPAPLVPTRIAPGRTYRDLIPCQLHSPFSCQCREGGVQG